MGAAADCESIDPGLLGQPVNALTTLVFVGLGVWLLLESRGGRWPGIAMIATGVGSFLFHGPMPPGNEWAHDLSLAWLLAVIAGTGSRWQALSRKPALLILGLSFALAPGIADPLAVLLTVLAAWSVLRGNRSGATTLTLLLAGAAGIYGRLGATGGPLCDASSIWQPHGVWHVVAALAAFRLLQKPPPLTT